MIKLMLICNDPELAKISVANGVDRIFLDLEVFGKRDRQGHRDTVISCHHMDDVPKVRAAVPHSELLVRLNPIHAGTGAEVEQALDGGADLIMLPMFRRAEEVRRLVEFVDGRAGVIPLVETSGASESLPEVLKMPGVNEIYIGLNDLHADLGLTFIFEPLALGMVDRMAQSISAAGIPFGFGGIARMDEGQLVGERVLGEHVRLGSSSVILSRTFHRHGSGLNARLDCDEFRKEILRLRSKEAELGRRTPEEVEADRLRTVAIVKGIVEKDKD